MLHCEKQEREDMDARDKSLDDLPEHKFVVNGRGRYHFDKTELWVDPIVGGGWVWEGAILNNIERWLAPHKAEPFTIIDAGAHVGFHTVAYGNMFPAAVVEAFEPQRNLLEYLHVNINENGLTDRVNVHECAVGHVALSNVTIQDTPPNRHHGGRQLGTGTRSFPMITVDSLNLQNVKFMKIDVEGAESLVIFGAMETIARCLPIIVAENNEQVITQDMIKVLGLGPEMVHFNYGAFLTSLGYKKIGRVHMDDCWAATPISVTQY